jgi:hypothetical protein
VGYVGYSCQGKPWRPEKNHVLRLSIPAPVLPAPAVLPLVLEPWQFFLGHGDITKNAHSTTIFGGILPWI